MSHLTKDAIIAAASEFSFLDVERLSSLYHLARDVSDLRGCFVECGCGLGGSALLLAHVAAGHGTKRDLILCDTFEGLPPLDRAVDVASGTLLGKPWTDADYASVVGSSKGNEDVIGHRCALAAPNVFVKTVKGLYGDTLQNWPHGPIALLHADADWYYSTKDILKNLWQHVLPGGAIIFDDYHYWDGCKKAVDEFFQANPPCPEWHKVSCSVWGRKP
jgi:O-methyltransferase